MRIFSVRSLVEKLALSGFGIRIRFRFRDRIRMRFTGLVNSASLDIGAYFFCAITGLKVSNIRIRNPDPVPGPNPEAFFRLS